MAVRIKDGMIPYTAWDGINITNNHVISVLLREMNNLIHVNENRELYVDLQLDDWIKPSDSLPVGVTTGRILQEDWRPQSWTILNWKTTSGDQVSFIYAADDSLYFSVNGWAWRLLAWSGEWFDTNVKAFYLNTTTEPEDLAVAQEALNWHLAWKYPIIKYLTQTYLFDFEEEWKIRFLDTFTTIYDQWQLGQSAVWQNKLYIFYNVDNEVTRIWMDTVQISPSVISTNTAYQSPFDPTQPYHPTTKKYVDDGLALKQDILTAWDNITIDQNNRISATIPSALVYKWNVQTINDLPSSWQTVWDTYFVEWVDWMYSWDGTQWNYVWSTSPSLTNYFNKTIDDSDDITEWSIHLFCTTVEKNYWDNKQDALTAWENIDITNNVISSPSYTGWNYISVNDHVIHNLKPFIPENEGVLNQVLKKTSTGYEWKNDTSNFNPENAGSTGQVLKKTETGYAWANESWGWGGWGWTSYNAWYWISITGHTISNTKPFEPTGWTGVTWDVLIKTANGYKWGNVSWSSNVRLFVLEDANDTTTAQEAWNWYLDWNLPILRLHSSHSYTDGAWVSHTITWDFDYYPEPTSAWSSTKAVFTTLHTTYDNYNNNISLWYSFQVDYVIELTLSWDTVTDINNTTHTNGNTQFISTWVWYSWYFVPTNAWHPASKWYVDSRNWVWTQTQYDNLPSIDPTVIYNIIPSS